MFGIVPVVHRAAAPASALLANLVSWWELGEAGTGTRFDSVVASANDLADNNAATQGAGVNGVGKATATARASSQNLSRASNAALTANNQPVALSVWVLLLSKPGGNMNIVNKTDGATNEFIIDWQQSADRFRFIVHGSAQHIAVANSLGSPALNTWYHIVGQYDDVNNLISIQVNNGAVDSVAHSQGVTNGTGAFYVGSYASSLNYFDGRIAKLGFWKAPAGSGKILSAALVTLLYGGGAPLSYPWALAPAGPPTLNWSNYAGNPLIQDGTYNRRDPSRIINVGGTYYVYYTRYANGGDPLTGSIYYATAPALHGPWTEQGEAIPHGAGGAWDDKGTLAPDAIVVGGTVYLFYRGDTNSNSRSNIGVASASSPAGPFTKNGGNPVLKNATDAADGGVWDTVIADNPFPVLQADGSWRLYYKGRTVADNDRKFGVATTSGGSFPAGWAKYRSNPIFPAAGTVEWEDPCVIGYQGQSYLMGCHPAAQTDEEFYKSPDGLADWVVAQDIPSVLAANLPAWANTEDHGFQWSLIDGNVKPTYIVFHARDGGHLLGIGILDLS